MEPADIGRLVGASKPVVSPDGGTIAFVVSRTDLDANRYRSAVWLAAADGSSAAYQFSEGVHGDGDPTWSPDGRRLAFTSRRGEGDGTKPGDREATLHIGPVTIPGEVVTLVSRKEGFEGLAWSPDGSHLAFTSRVPATDVDDDRARPARRIDRFLSRIDGHGWIIDRPNHVFVVAVDGSAQPLQLTDGTYEHSAPAWSPDGSELAFVAARHDGWDLGERSDVYLVRADGSSDEPVKVTATDRAVQAVSWDPGGSGRLAVVAFDNPEVAPQNGRIQVVERTSGAIIDVTAELDRNCAPYGSTRAPIWDGDRVVFAAEDRGAQHVLAAPADGSGKPEVLLGGSDRVVVDYDLVAGTLAYTTTTTVRRPEVFVADPSAPAGERRLSFVTDAFHRACPSHPATRFTVPCTDGSDEVDAWMMAPSGVDPSDPSADLPMLLSIHGGPFTQYGENWFDEFQLWASAGYVVVYANPRGSSGREVAWGRAIRSKLAEEVPGSGWGGVDADDLLAVLDAALERWPGIDRERVGVLGGSYGGYMTSWLIGTTDRFAAACSERAVNNVLTLETASDAGGFFRRVIGVSHLDHPEEYLAQSPITHVKSITTPVLILHSENDLRCPIEQADQLFVALRLLGREQEYHRFPAEGHELSRSGAPKHRVQRAELILDWFDRHLRPNGDDDGDAAGS